MATNRINVTIEMAAKRAASALRSVDSRALVASGLRYDQAIGARAPIKQEGALMYKVVFVGDSPHTGRVYTRESLFAAKDSAHDHARKRAGEPAEFVSRGPRGEREIGYRGANGTAFVYELADGEEE